MKHGVGKEEYTNGKRFVGEWVQGKFMTGKGSQKGEKGWEAEWKKGVRQT